MVIDHLIPSLHVIGIYRSSSNVSLAKFINALNYLHDSKLKTPDTPVVLLGDFNVNLLERITVNSPTDQLADGPTRRRIKSSRNIGELVVNPIQLIRS